MRLRIRSIKPEFFSDERINSISRDARYLAIGLITRSDDRGRQQNMPLALLGHVYPSGDVSVRQVQKWLAEIIREGIARPYDVGPFQYLWLPNFWRHQKINRPSESQLPPHPDDPFKDLPICGALEVFRGERDSEELTELLTEDLIPPRAGARSDPIKEEKTTSQGKKVDARARPKRADPNAPPDDLPPNLRPVLDSVLAALAKLQGERGGNAPTVRGVGLALVRFPDRDHMRSVRELEHWALAGNGQGRPVKDWARTFATFLDRSPVGAPLREAARPSARSLVEALNAREEDAA